MTTDPGASAASELETLGATSEPLSSSHGATAEAQPRGATDVAPPPGLEAYGPALLRGDGLYLQAPHDDPAPGAGATRDESAPHPGPSGRGGPPGVGALRGGDHAEGQVSHQGPGGGRLGPGFSEWRPVIDPEREGQRCIGQGSNIVGGSSCQGGQHVGDPSLDSEPAQGCPSVPLRATIEDHGDQEGRPELREALLGGARTPAERTSAPSSSGSRTRTRRSGSTR